jgi:Ca2+-binding RTX toxin-like protein
MPTIYGTNFSEVINQFDGVTNNADTIYGYGGNDTIYGLGGDDMLKGGAGADWLVGGEGIDSASYADSSEGVVVSLTSGQGFNGTAEDDTLVGIENLYGSSYADWLVGNAEANMLSGLNGDDVLDGGNGADTLYGGNGADTLKGGGGADTLAGGNGADTLDGGTGIDTADYSASAGGVYVSLLSGSGLWNDAAGDDLESIENVTGSAHGDELWGDTGTNVLTGGNGGDQLYGYSGDDVLNGGAGNDTLKGGTGTDTMYGGADADRFVFASVAEFLGSLDMVMDFNVVEGDQLDVHAVDANDLLVGNQDFVFIGSDSYSAAGQIRFGTDGVNTYIGLNTDADFSDSEAVFGISGVVTPDASWFSL